MVELDFEEWLMTMRDYPQPYVSMVDGHVWGKLAGAEAEGNERGELSGLRQIQMVALGQSAG